MEARKKKLPIGIENLKKFGRKAFTMWIRQD